MDLNDYGLERYLRQAGLSAGAFQAGRVCAEDKSGYQLATAAGPAIGILRGKTLGGLDGMDFPKAGDWVRIRPLPGEAKAVIEEVLPRQTKLSRRTGEGQEQVIAANVDEVFIIQGLPNDFNLRRLERYLVAARQGGAQPVVVLNKIDLEDEYPELVKQAEEVAGDAPVLAASARTGSGMDALRQRIRPGMTFAFLGSSGVGKSSLVNALAGEDLQAAGEIRERDGRGRHTTTRRQLIRLPGGGLLLDTPGMRELGLDADQAEIRKSFDDIEELARLCRYSNCDHDKSQGCALKQALESGELDQARYAGFLKLVREREYQESRQDSAKQRDRKTRDKKRNSLLKRRLEEKY